MNNRDRLLTVDKVMEIIPLGKTSVTAIVKSVPHVTMGRKLMVYESEVSKWVQAHTIDPNASKTPAKRPRTPRNCMLTADGLIPTRAQLRARERGASA